MSVRQAVLQGNVDVRNKDYVVDLAVSAQTHTSTVKINNSTSRHPTSQKRSMELVDGL